MPWQKGVQGWVGETWGGSSACGSPRGAGAGLGRDRTLWLRREPELGPSVALSHMGLAANPTLPLRAVFRQVAGLRASPRHLG